ncbi:unnamed protein product [Nezara viridula]|uniref:Uncharacterized protein n=1 Tax=Nezara viridula TaxID=85310 RepID=A0A9P0E9M4_NEZVI|nr:unnamed protein product [Nezara viridula]
MEKIRNHHSSKDIDRVLNSKSNPRYRKICSFNVTRPEDYLQFRALNLNKLRAVSRLRVASKDFMKIYLKDATLTIKSSEARRKIEKRVVREGEGVVQGALGGPSLCTPLLLLLVGPRQLKDTACQEQPSSSPL